MTQKVLITGAAGFIGKYLVEYFLDKDFEVVGTTHSSKPYTLSQKKENFRFYTVDIRDEKKVFEIIENEQPDWLYHLAAQSYPTVSWKDPVYTIETNILGTTYIFESVKKLDLNTKIFVACSSAEYGYVPKREAPVSETHLLQPLHPYGVSKVAQDLLAYQYYKNFGIRCTRGRIFNTTGPGKKNDVCSDFAYQIAKIKCKLSKPLIEVGNLEAERDITDVRDMVRAIVMATEKGKDGEVYNLCSMKAYKIKDVLNLMIELSGVDIEVRVKKELLRPTDEPIIMGDNRKLQNDTGWKPQFKLKQTLKDMIDYCVLDCKKVST